MGKIVDVWRKDTAEWITPETVVWAVKMYNSYFPNGLLFDRAFLTEESLQKNCFWFKDKGVDTKLSVSMSFETYLKLHLEECSPMNPFWGIGRVDFLMAYREKYTAANQIIVNNERIYKEDNL